MADSPSNFSPVQPSPSPDDAALRRIRLVVEYDGTDFVGWQRQENGPSVQAAIEEAAAKLTCENHVTVIGAGRTDSGVHALGQVATFSTHARHSLSQIRRGLNANLPRSIAVSAVDEVALDFDPRRAAQGKLYRYVIWNAPARRPRLERTAWFVKPHLDETLMQAGANFLVGKHDFSAFRASACTRTNTVRLVRRLDVTRENHLINIEIEATAFLQHMVRIIAGTLVDVGRGFRLPEEVGEILTSGNRSLAGPTAPPHGLTLVHVNYPSPLPA